MWTIGALSETPPRRFDEICLQIVELLVVERPVLVQRRAPIHVNHAENKNYVDDKNYVESVDQFRETLHENRGSVQ